MAIDCENKSSLFEKVNIIVFIGALIYFTGWMYCYHIFKYFNILSSTYYIPVYHILIYSYSVISDKYIYPILLSFFVSFCLLFHFLPHKKLYTYLFIILYMLSFIILNNGAKRMATKEINRITNGIQVNHIRFILKEDDSHKFPSYFYDLNNKGELIYIYSTNDRYYVFSPEKDNSKKSSGTVFDIPISDVVIEIIIHK